MRHGCLPRICRLTTRGPPDGGAHVAAPPRKGKPGRRLHGTKKKTVQLVQSAGGTIGDGLRRREQEPLALSPYPNAALLEAQAPSRWEREDGATNDVKDHAAQCAPNSGYGAQLASRPGQSSIFKGIGARDCAWRDADRVSVGMTEGHGPKRKTAARGPPLHVVVARTETISRRSFRPGCIPNPPGSGDRRWTRPRAGGRCLRRRSRPDRRSWRTDRR